MDSVVGGDAPSRQTKVKADAIKVEFWGICDIKYDPRRPNPKDRVHLLELGDGRSSRFSQHGRAIKEKFDAEYCMSDYPIKRQTLTENKKLTHDMFVNEGFGHLRPPTVAYQRRYYEGLDQDILRDLGITERSGAVVLKLCNRSRGAGIVVTTAAELDDVLRRLLTPPFDDVEEWLKKYAPHALEPKGPDMMEECRLHWWSNECPLFMAEKCCSSVPVAMEGSDRLFDGTMRVAFALHRKVKKYGKDDVRPFEIDWLGGYWKLPKVGIEEAGYDLDGLHSRVVSSFNSVEKRTAEVEPEHLKEVFDALTPALPMVFHSGALSVHRIMNSYQEEPLFRAFVLSRVAAGMRAGELAKAVGLFDLARRNVPQNPSIDAERLPECSVLSYIERNAGVCPVLEGKWAKAELLWRRSISLHPMNSTAYYCLGCCHQESGAYDAAVACQRKSIALDPDFKSPYLALGNAHMLKHEFGAAMEAAEVCLTRHVDAPVALFIIAQCTYHLSCQKDLKQRKDRLAMIERATKAFDLAKRRVPEQWTEGDEAMLQYLESGCPTMHQQQAVHVWKVYGWRP